MAKYLATTVQEAIETQVTIVSKYLKLLNKMTLRRDYHLYYQSYKRYRDMLRAARDCGRIKIEQEFLNPGWKTRLTVDKEFMDKH